jgi:hypothetical protein
MIEVKWKGLDEIKRDLETMQKRAVPYAMKEALNVSAHLTSIIWEDEIEKSFTLRNQYTRKSIRVERARGLNVRNMRAVVGTISPYLPKDESGATIRGKGKSKAVPTAVAAGQRFGATRTRPVRPFKSIQLPKLPAAVEGYANARFNAASMAIARRKGSQFALLRRKQGGMGIFRLGSGKRRMNPRLVWNLSRSSVKLRPIPTLARTLIRVRPMLDGILRDAFIGQCRFHHIAGY